MMYVTLTFWLCAAGTPAAGAGEDGTACDRVALPWYGSFVACQMHGQAEIADWLRRAGREGERVLRYRCTAEPVPGGERLARADGPPVAPAQATSRRSTAR